MFTLLNEITTTTTEPSDSGSSEINKVNTVTRFNYDECNFEGFQNISINGKTFREHMKNNYPELNIEEEVKKAVNWLIARDKDKGDRSIVGGYSFLVNWFNRASAEKKCKKE